MSLRLTTASSARMSGIRGATWPQILRATRTPSPGCNCKNVSGVERGSVQVTKYSQKAFLGAFGLQGKLTDENVRWLEAHGTQLLEAWHAAVSLSEFPDKV